MKLKFHGILILLAIGDGLYGQNNRDRFAGSFSATFDTGCIIFGKGSIRQTRLAGLAESLRFGRDVALLPVSDIGISDTRLHGHCHIKVEKFVKPRTGKNNNEIRGLQS